MRLHPRCVVWVHLTGSNARPLRDPAFFSDSRVERQTLPLDCAVAKVIRSMCQTSHSCCCAALALQLNGVGQPRSDFAIDCRGQEGAFDALVGESHPRLTESPAPDPGGPWCGMTGARHGWPRRGQPWMSRQTTPDGVGSSRETTPSQRGPFIDAEFVIPPGPDGLVDRPRLLKQLRIGTKGPLTLVSAPAGTGKTVLVSSWAVAGAETHPGYVDVAAGCRFSR